MQKSKIKMTPNKLLRNYTGQAMQNAKRIPLPLLFPPPPSGRGRIKVGEGILNI